MSKKHRNVSGIVYSTDPDFNPPTQEEEAEQTLLPKDQRLIIRIDKKHRAGKMVTLIEGFVGTPSDKDQLIKQLKAFCGTGGSSKDGELLIQGDQKQKVQQWLSKNGYQQVISR